MYKLCGVEYGSVNYEFMAVRRAGFQQLSSDLIASQISKLGIPKLLLKIRNWGLE
jgi:hypothetical protein